MDPSLRWDDDFRGAGLSNVFIAKCRDDSFDTGWPIELGQQQHIHPVHAFIRHANDMDNKILGILSTDMEIGSCLQWQPADGLSGDFGQLGS